MFSVAYLLSLTLCWATGAVAENAEQGVPAPKGSILIQYRDVNTAINQRRPTFQGSMAGSAANSAWGAGVGGQF